jgi:hypothetical protein
MNVKKLMLFGILFAGAITFAACENVSGNTSNVDINNIVAEELEEIEKTETIEIEEEKEEETDIKADTRKLKSVKSTIEFDDYPDVDPIDYTTVEYDEKGNVIFEVDEDSQKREIVYEYENDKITKITETINSPYLTGRPYTLWCIPEYDEKGNIIKKLQHEEDYDGLTSVFLELFYYDDNNRSIKEEQYREVDETGEIISNYGSYCDEYTYDTNGRLISECHKSTNYGGEESISYSCDYEYDENNNCICTWHYKDGGTNTDKIEYEYNEEGLCIKERHSSDGGATIYYFYEYFE